MNAKKSLYRYGAEPGPTELDEADAFVLCKVAGTEDDPREGGALVEVTVGGEFGTIESRDVSTASSMCDEERKARDGPAWERMDAGRTRA